VRANRAVLDRAGLEVIELEAWPFETNFYLGNGCVIVPVAGARSRAVATLREVFPDREVVAIDGKNLARCGAACIASRSACWASRS
jgi:agmatine/peptidylarginine deiminase